MPELRDYEELNTLLEQRCRAKIEAVAMDISSAYISAVQTHLSKAVIVFDHFHVIKLFNHNLADLHRAL